MAPTTLRNLPSEDDRPSAVLFVLSRFTCGLFGLSQKSSRSFGLNSSPGALTPSHFLLTRLPKKVHAFLACGKESFGRWPHLCRTLWLKPLYPWTLWLQAESPRSFGLHPEEIHKVPLVGDWPRKRPENAICSIQIMRRLVSDFFYNSACQHSYPKCSTKLKNSVCGDWEYPA